MAAMDAVEVANRDHCAAARRRGRIVPIQSIDGHLDGTLNFELGSLNFES